MSDNENESIARGSDPVGKRLAEIAQEQIKPIKELTEKLNQERIVAMEKAKKAEALA